MFFRLWTGHLLKTTESICTVCLKALYISRLYQQSTWESWEETEYNILDYYTNLKIVWLLRSISKQTKTMSMYSFGKYISQIWFMMGMPHQIKWIYAHAKRHTTWRWSCQKSMNIWQRLICHPFPPQHKKYIIHLIYVCTELHRQNMQSQAIVRVASRRLEFMFEWNIKDSEWINCLATYDIKCRVGVAACGANWRLLP